MNQGSWLHSAEKQIVCISQATKIIHIAKLTYPGVYSGIMTFFPNRENVYPIVAAATSGCVEASTICGRLKEGPDEGSFMTSEIIVAVAAIPIATATFAQCRPQG